MKTDGDFFAQEHTEFWARISTRASPNLGNHKRKKVKMNKGAVVLSRRLDTQEKEAGSRPAGPPPRARGGKGKRKGRNPHGAGSSGRSRPSKLAPPDAG